MAQAFLAVRACYKYVILTQLLHWLQLSVPSAAGVLQLNRFYMLVTLLKYVAAVPLYREKRILVLRLRRLMFVWFIA